LINFVVIFLWYVLNTGPSFSAMPLVKKHYGNNIYESSKCSVVAWDLISFDRGLRHRPPIAAGVIARRQMELMRQRSLQRLTD